ncbi:MAG: thrombospondin type 3 repeat-containing protein [bacterium]|nr:thrombospondin type 3 repeat-containing protein [bacterium]
MTILKQGLAKNLIFSSIILVIAAIQFLIMAKNVDAAAVACAKATVNVVARDQNGQVIPGIAYEISEPAVNSDGEIRPGKIVSSGKIDKILGQGKSIFSPTAGSYVVKMSDKNSNYGAFYFYNELTVGCGEEKTFTAYLSGLQIELRDANGTLRKNTSFSLSLQAYDANEEPIKQKGALIASMNSETAGQKTIYLADNSHTIDQAPINYVFSSPGYGGSEFVIYNISLTNGRTKELNYAFSDVMIRFKDKNKNILPAGTKVEFLKQKSDVTGRVVADKLIKTLSIDSDGYVLFEYPAGTYFVRIKKTNGNYYNFTDIKLVDRFRTTLILDAVDNSYEQAVCGTNSILKVVARQASGGYIAGIKIELYEKILNANNAPAAGALAAKGVTDALGYGSLSFKPSQGKAYILKMSDKNAKVGAFWFYDEIKFSCGENKNIAKNLSGLNFSLRDISGNLLKNYAFSLYLQKQDIDGNLLKTKDNLVVDSKINADGQAKIYVTGGDPTQYQDIARYLISVKYNGLVFDQPDINLTVEKDTQINYALSGLSLTAVDGANNRLTKAAPIDVYEQKLDTSNKKILGKKITRILFDNNGKGAAALPAGSYVLSFKDKSGQTINIFDIKIDNGSLNSKTIANGKIVVVASPAASALAERLKGYVLLQVESSGRAWYVNPKDKKRYYMQDGAESFATMRNLGLGVSKGDLSKIPVGVLSIEGEADCDNDGLPDALEIAIGTAVCNPDTDGDGYGDSIEVRHNYNPLGPGKSIIDQKLAVKLSGALLLPVESNVEIWYVNPRDKKRYFLPDSAAAFKIMRYLSLGITNANLNLIDQAN